MSHEDVRRSLEILDNVLAEFDDDLAVEQPLEISEQNSAEKSRRKRRFSAPKLDGTIEKLLQVGSGCLRTNSFHIKLKEEDARFSISDQCTQQYTQQCNKIAPPPVPKRKPTTRLSKKPRQQELGDIGSPTLSRDPDKKDSEPTTESLSEHTQVSSSQETLQMSAMLEYKLPSVAQRRAEYERISFKTVHPVSPETTSRQPVVKDMETPKKFVPAKPPRKSVKQSPRNPNTNMAFKNCDTSSFALNLTSDDSPIVPLHHSTPNSHHETTVNTTNITVKIILENDSSTSTENQKKFFDSTASSGTANQVVNSPISSTAEDQKKKLSSSSRTNQVGNIVITEDQKKLIPMVKELMSTPPSLRKTNHQEASTTVTKDQRKIALKPRDLKSILPPTKKEKVLEYQSLDGDSLNLTPSSLKTANNCSVLNGSVTTDSTTTCMSTEEHSTTMELSTKRNITAIFIPPPPPTEYEDTEIHNGHLMASKGVQMSPDYAVSRTLFQFLDTPSVYDSGFESDIKSLSLNDTIEDLPRFLPTDTLNRPHLGLSYAMEEDYFPEIKPILTSAPKFDKSTQTAEISCRHSLVENFDEPASQSDIELERPRLLKPPPVECIKSLTLPTGLKLGSPLPYAIELENELRTRNSTKLKNEDSFRSFGSDIQSKPLLKKEKKLFGFSRKEKQSVDSTGETHLSLDNIVLHRVLPTDDSSLNGSISNESTASEEKFKKKSIWKSILRRNPQR